MTKVPPLKSVSVTGGTEQVKGSLLDLSMKVKDLLSSKKPNYEAACSLLVDLSLEKGGESKLGEVMDILAKEKAVGDNVLNKFGTEYLEPSIKIMKRIGNPELAAAKFDLKVDVQTSDAEALKSLDKAMLMFGDPRDYGVEGVLPVMSFNTQQPATFNGNRMIENGLRFDDKTAKIQIVVKDKEVQVIITDKVIKKGVEPEKSVFSIAVQ